jgi:uncharacterized protein with von Willebrand factor type A (vWA) domain
MDNKSKKRKHLENKFKDLKRQKLPLALNKEEVEKILNSVHNIKHKAISGINKISESSKKKGDV